MTVFKIVAESGVEGLDFYDEFVDKFTKGDKVRVIDGVFKGAEGHIVRIKKNHRLCVCITGLCAVATGYIPKAFLEKIYEELIQKKTICVISKISRSPWPAQATSA